MFTMMSITIRSLCGSTWGVLCFSVLSHGSAFRTSRCRRFCPPLEWGFLCLKALTTAKFFGSESRLCVKTQSCPIHGETENASDPSLTSTAGDATTAKMSSSSITMWSQSCDHSTKTSIVCQQSSSMWVSHFPC